MQSLETQTSIFPEAEKTIVEIFAGGKQYNSLILKKKF